MPRNPVGKESQRGNAEPSSTAESESAEAGTDHRIQFKSAGAIPPVGEGFRAHVASATDNAYRSGPAAVQLKPKLSDATPQEQTEQHTKAGSRSSFAMQASVKLVAQRMRDAATELGSLGTLSESDLDEAGWAKPRMRAEGLIDRTAEDLDRLAGELKTSGNTTTNVGPELGLLRGAHFLFENTMPRLRGQFERKGDPLDPDTHEKVKQALKSLHEELGLTGSESQDRPGLGPLDKEGEDKLRATALDNNLSAAFESARSVRMGMSKATDRVVVRDLNQLEAHLGEVDALLTQFKEDITITSFDKTPDRKHELAALKKSLTKFKPRLKQLVAEVKAIVAEDDQRGVAGVRDKKLSELATKIKTTAGV
jgi:hypothetical protein